MQYTTAISRLITGDLLFYQDFKDTFVCNTQRNCNNAYLANSCFIRISKILLYAIHNTRVMCTSAIIVVLSGFQRYFCMQYTTRTCEVADRSRLFYQDFKDTFVCNTQLDWVGRLRRVGCFIRISKILLYAIHNVSVSIRELLTLFYQDFKDTFVCNTQQSFNLLFLCKCCFIRISKILLYAIHNPFGILTFWKPVVFSGFQRYFCMQYTTNNLSTEHLCKLFYQDFKDTFVCNTQLAAPLQNLRRRCFIRISKILLYAIHNILILIAPSNFVVLSGFQRYFCMQYTTY